MRTLVLLLFVSLAGYAQTIRPTKAYIKQLFVTDSCMLDVGSPAPNKIATSMDINGRLQWVYFSDFQDSINTGVYDTGSFNTVRIRAPFTDEILGLGSDSTVTGCGIGCDSLNAIADTLKNSPWTYNGTGNIVQRDTSLNVGIGTSNPTAKLHLNGSLLVKDSLTTGNFFTKTSEEFYKISVDPVSGISFIGTDAASSDTVFSGAYYNSNSSIMFSGISAKRDTLDAYVSVFPDGNITIEAINLNSFNSATIGVSTEGITLQTTRKTIITSDTITLVNGTQANGYVLTSDADGNATWQDHTAYGEMGFGDSTVAQALTQNVWHVVTNSNKTLWQTAAQDTHNVQYSGDSLIIGKAGTYQINTQLSIDGTNGSIIRLGVYLNGALACACTGYQELTNNHVIQLSYINVDTLAQGDVIKVVIMNTANNDNVDAISGKITLVKIR